MDSSNAIYALLYACFAQTRYMLYQIGLVEDEVDEKQHLISGTTGPKGFWKLCNNLLNCVCFFQTRIGEKN